VSAERRVFLTGFPGFIGRRLVEKILSKEPGAKVLCLVEPRFELRAREEARRLDAGGDRVAILAGDITAPDLGMDPDAGRDLASRVTDVFHLAAVYDLAVPEAVARRVNVRGTRHVIEFARTLKGLRRLVHFSTCYVSGLRTGTIYEDELDMGQRFKNHYESTKHDSEYLVRQAMREMDAIVIRPSVVVGDSRTGETQKFDGPYFGMILIDTLRRLRVPLPYLGPSRAEINIVPVDYIVDGTVALWQKEGVAGSTFALADSRPMTSRELYAQIVRGLGALGPLGAVPPLLVDVPLRIPHVRRLLGVPREVLEYFNHPAHYDCSRALAALEGTGVACPDLRSYLPAVLDYYVRNRDRRELRWEAV